MHSKKPLSKFLALLMVICMSMQLLWIPASAIGQTDYTGHWAQSSIEKLLQNSIISGDDSGKINPDGNMTRAEFIKIINRTFGYTAMSDLNYPDVQSDTWYANEFRIARQAGYIQGDSNGNANPKSPITKDEVCTIIARVLGLSTTTDAKLAFSDESEIDSWAYGSVKSLFDSGFITGNPDNSFKGGNQIKRAECFTILAKIIDKGLNKSEAPTASVTPGTYYSTQTVELKSKTTGANIYYTTDDTAPTVNSTKYTSAITVNKTLNIKAIAIKDGLQASAVAIFAYTISTSGYGGGGGGGIVTPPTPPTSTITREQWVVALMNKLGMSVTADQLPKDESGKTIFTFADTANSANALTIEAAVSYGALTVDASETTHYLHPSDPCTREFAAVTAVRVLKFIDSNGKLECSDAADLKYQSLDAIAVKVGLISLINGKFMPASNLTTAEETSILDRALSIHNPPEITSDKAEFDYSDDLIQLAAEKITGYSVTVEGSKYTVVVPKNDSTKDLKADDVIALPKSDKYPDGLALKISTVTENEDGTLTLTCIVPEVSEVLDSMNVQGTATGDFNNFIPSDEIEIVNEFSEPAAVENSAKLMANAKPEVKFTKKPDGSAEAEIAIPDTDGTKTYASINFGVPHVRHKEDVDWLHFNVRDLYFIVEETNTITGGMEWSGEHTAKIKSFKIGELPIYAGGARIASIDLLFKVEASGKWEVKLELANQFGVRVINNEASGIANIRPSVSLNTLEGELKIGPDLKAVFETKVPLIENPVSIADVDLFAALGLKGSLKQRNTGMLCIDVLGYIPVELSAGGDAAENSFLYQLFQKCGIECSWVICDEDHTPWRKNIHAEDGKIVPECTYEEEQGQLTGVVLQASDRHTPIPNAAIEIYNDKNVKVETLTSGNDGSFTCKLGVGSYSVWVSANGYKRVGNVVSIAKDENTYLESFLMVNKPDDPNATGVAGGNITDSLTGSAISNVKVTVRDNMSNTTGEVVYTYTTGSEGKYEVTLPVGNYTVLFEKDGYVTNYRNIVVQTTPTMDQHMTLNPTSTPSINGTIRMVLTWDQTPADLDSHLLGPAVNGTDRFHTYFDNKNYNNGSTKIANLDLDDIDSYGPETTTVYELNTSGVYSFYVHDFSNRDSSSSRALSQSRAQVKVYSGDTLIAVYNVPTNAEGTLWHVFDFDAATKSIKVSNNMSYTTAPGDVGKSASLINNTSENADINIIAGSLTDKEAKTQTPDTKEPGDQTPDAKLPDTQTTDTKTPESIE